VLDRPDASIDTCYCLSAMHVRVEEGRYVSARRESTNNASQNGVEWSYTPNVS
jgi:hypothetical protein